MKKIISLFQRNYDGDRLVRNEVVPGAKWVIAGEGIPTRKFDGACCMVKAGELYRRYDAKHGKTPPAGFIPAQDPDPETGHWPGWVKVGDGSADIWFRAAFHVAISLSDGTYEAVGPHFNANPEGIDFDRLIVHGGVVLQNCPRDFDRLKTYLERTNIEGVVWHHPDGRMVKIKGKDFGLRRF